MISLHSHFFWNIAPHFSIGRGVAMPLGGTIITTCCSYIIINKQTDAFINPVPKPLHHAYLRVRLQIELIDPSDGCATSDHLQRLVIHADEEQRFPDAHVQEGSCAYIV
jgi:hypothetical protein